MKKIILLVIIFINIFLYLSCNDIEKSFIENLKQSIDNIQKKNINLEFFTNFKWDLVYIFTPYTPIKEIYKRLGFNWMKVRKIDINARDDINLLVFVKNNKVIEYIEVPRSYGDFSNIKIKKGLKPKEAIFKLNVLDDWPYLELVE